MIHLVFNEGDVEVLQKAIELDETLQGDVIQVKDDYAVGPLDNIYSEKGIEERRQWWRDILAGGDYEGHVDDGKVDDNKMLNVVLSMSHSEELPPYTYSVGLHVEDAQGQLRAQDDFGLPNETA